LSAQFISTQSRSNICIAAGVGRIGSCAGDGAAVSDIKMPIVRTMHAKRFEQGWRS
jgi:hypothetical protein